MTAYSLPSELGRVGGGVDFLEPLDGDVGVGLGRGRQVSRYENDEVVPSVNVVIKVAKAFDGSVDDLVFEDVPRRPLVVLADGLADRLPQIQELNDEDKASLFQILDALVTKNHVKSLARKIA